MKKIIGILYIIFLIHIGSSYAQGNISETTQSGNNNQAMVSQIGSSHESMISQNTWGEGHQAIVGQSSGNDNFSSIQQTQRKAEAYITQSGSQNQSRLSQAGPNEAKVLQEGEQNILGQYNEHGKNAYQKNGTSFSDDVNWLDLHQNGTANKTGIWQEHHGKIEIAQFGDYNESDVYQKANPAGGKLTEAYIHQEGSSNNTNIRQVGENDNAWVNIIGNNNDFYISQTGNNASLRLETMGNDNTGNFWQNMVLASSSGSSAYSSIDAYIHGDKNMIDATQNGARNRLKINIINDSYGNDLYIMQNGDQGFPGYADINVHIEGDLNNVSLTQDGNFNKIGSFDGAPGVDITGNQNSVQINQMGNWNSATAIINGDFNKANIIQK